MHTCTPTYIHTYRREAEASIESAMLRPEAEEAARLMREKAVQARLAADLAQVGMFCV